MLLLYTIYQQAVCIREIRLLTLLYKLYAISLAFIVNLKNILCIYIFVSYTK